MCQSTDYLMACGHWHDEAKALDPKNIYLCNNVGAGCSGVKPNPHLPQSRQKCLDCYLLDQAKAAQKQADVDAMAAQRAYKEQVKGAKKQAKSEAVAGKRKGKEEKDGGCVIL